MGRLRQKGKAGAAKAYITRTAAVKKLQCSLADFRRLCILKGIYPREPRSRKKANKGNSAPTSFYYAKDIAYLQHEPVLRKLREHKAFAKKLSRAMGRGEWTIAKGLEERKPVYKLDHIVKERYPTFIDALRDIDDALCLVALFANLPANDRIPSSLVENCARLYNEWQLYVINTKSLRKVFLSIKGVYYQAIVQGETINWIVPWQFTQTIPSDVDIRVMLTFLELYQTLLGFIFFKLYTDEGWVYPPPLDENKDEGGAGVNALNVVERSAAKAGQTEANTKTVSNKEVRQAIKEISSTTINAPSATSAAPEAMEVEEDEEFVPQASKSDPNATSTSNLTTFKAISANSSVNPSARLFEGLNFWLSRETPRGLLEFVIRSHGGRVGWDASVGSGSMFEENSEGITHVIIDRPSVSGPSTSASGNEATANPKEDRRRKYIQPQWIVDCINAGKILSEEKYERGKVLPPHLSPFGEDKNAYDPTAENDGDTKMQEAENSESESEEEEEVIEGEELPDEEEDQEEDSDAEMKRQAEEKKLKKKALKKAKDGVKGGDAAALRAAELEAEAAGVDYVDFQKAIKVKSTSAKEKKGTEESGKRIEEEEKEMNKMLMSNKQRKLYEKMKFSERKRETEKAMLEQRKAEIQKAKKKEAKKTKEGRA